MQVKNPEMMGTLLAEGKWNIAHHRSCPATCLTGVNVSHCSLLYVSVGVILRQARKHSLDNSHPPADEYNRWLVNNHDSRTEREPPERFQFPGVMKVYYYSRLVFQPAAYAV